MCLAKYHHGIISCFILKSINSIASFTRFYRNMCDKADSIFRESNLCQWERNSDGTFSCFINRRNSQNRPPELKETDGCCIELCKNPGDFNDAVIKRRQHSKKTGCLIKSLKCKLHICSGLIQMSENNPAVKKYIDEILALQKMFINKYEKLWRDVPYAASKSAYTKYFLKHYR